MIPETGDLPTRFARIVITDADGCDVLPDLPKARYQIRVRGYGLVDVPKVLGGPGTSLNLRPVPAASASPLSYYPAVYSEFGGAGPIPARITHTDLLAIALSVEGVEARCTSTS